MLRFTSDCLAAFLLEGLASLATVFSGFEALTCVWLLTVRSKASRYGRARKPLAKHSKMYESENRSSFTLDQEITSVIPV